MHIDENVDQLDNLFKLFLLPPRFCHLKWPNLEDYLPAFGEMIFPHLCMSFYTIYQDAFVMVTLPLKIICGHSYKHFTLVNYDSRVVIWGFFQSGTTLES